MCYNCFSSSGENSVLIASVFQKPEEKNLGFICFWFRYKFSDSQSLQDQNHYTPMQEKETVHHTHNFNKIHLDILMILVKKYSYYRKVTEFRSNKSIQK